MKKVFVLFFAMMCSMLSMAQVAQMVGKWTTIDDKSGEKVSVVQIYKASNGKYYGKIVELLRPADKGQVCTPCTGSDKNKPVEGLIIIRDMEEQDGKLVGGRVLDPENGKFYYAKITLENGKLVLRGSLDKAGLLGRNQTWIRKK